MRKVYDVDLIPIQQLTDDMDDEYGYLDLSHTSTITRDEEGEVTGNWFFDFDPRTNMVYTWWVADDEKNNKCYLTQNDVNSIE